ncbi:Asp-tRNA(Asn)/Glu-tRNA(Gln) amidotransferase A subunit family amidase [Granulicella aggregans]|uniref:Asp-tRNA(Asn)/Glu-tRNA(Gln) amidotransferase A subunit family amidase n=1 Tax=Granulicella aggregans TaxID=474949 RepID=A0A7W8E4L7_9BACT|nr:amidase [Granulicella aggregans]MBB5059193.1 Asp-tRNA(Asn)/Glu-tRNA(Gln) amidotransferase A subunit family amidase [Granulicella aggregans]
MPAPSRRHFLALCSALGLGNTLLPGTLFTLAAQTPATPEAPTKITPEMIDAAAAIAGITLTAEQKKMMLTGLTEQRDSLTAIRDLHIPNSVAPAFVFDPVPPGTVLNTVHKPAKLGPAPRVSIDVSNSEALAYATIRELSELLHTRKITSLALTKMYLARLRKYDPTLHFVITYTEDRALKQAAAADAEIAAGNYRGPLHGIPWAAKDLLAVKGYPTTWGAGGFESQTFDYDATIVQRLDDAGAVLIAKTTLGALAQGDLWGSKQHGARTRNPWNPRQGSSGSSAGSASATAAGCVAFAIGTETLGSIASPSTRCGVTGLRPSFGLVPRTGAMALSWTMDKIGPICRSVEDCAIVLSTIYGPDEHDLAVKSAAFNWDATLDWKTLRVGYLKSAFEITPPKPDAKESEKQSYTRRLYDAKYANATLDALRAMGVTLTPVELPDFPFKQIGPVLEAESAAAFDDLTRSGRDSLLAGQKEFDWPTTFRIAHLYSAVDYIQAMRARTLAIAKMSELFAKFDVIVTPSGGTQLTATNLTGQPAIIVPNGIRGNDAPPATHDDADDIDNPGGPGTPTSITFLGPLYSEARLATFAHAYQEKTGFHKLHPKLT